MPDRVGVPVFAMSPMNSAASDSIRDILVPPTMPILQAIEVLDRAHKRIILVVDESMTLLGVVTDSNLRHAVLDHLDLARPIADIMRARPVTALDSFSDDQILDLMEATTCYQVPIVDREGRLKGIRFLNDLLQAQRRRGCNTAMLMVGGLGTRLHPMTKQIPKPLLPVGGRPLLFTILDQLLAAGITRIFLSLNYRGDDIRQAVSGEARYAEAVRYVEENDRLGTAGALSLLPERPGQPLLVMNGDLLTKVDFEEMVRFHLHERNVMTVALTTQKVKVPYGVARLEGTRIIEMVEKPEHTHFVNAGVYIIEPYVLDRVPSGTYVDMTTLIDDLIANDLRVGSFPVREYWLDIGTPDQLAKAEREYDTVFGDKSGNG